MGLFGRSTPDLQNWDTYTVSDDFCHGGINLSGTVTGGMWQIGGGAASGCVFPLRSGGLGGIAQVKTPAVDSNEGLVTSVPEVFSLTSGGSLYLKARARVGEITSGATGAIVGWASAPNQSGILLGNGVRASGNVVALIKTSGQGNWSLAGNVQTSGLTVQGVNTSVGQTVSGDFQDLELFVNPDRGNVQISAAVNGKYLKQHLTDVQPIVLTFPADATPMSVVLGVKQAGAESATLDVKKVHAQQSENRK